MTIDIKIVHRISKLARIKIPEADVDSLKGDLNRILGWIEQLSEVNTDNIQPLYNISLKNMPRREDQITDGNYPNAILANAPEAEFGMFIVPKVVE
ncbi:MAG: Asp-tRNA(Asn)/Glu-tRNA(Gln) amidotransferase subunit GatC [Candidatus Paracaedimonas acanthamoebae]|uniref:Aspartyl/glutamyl-tRNA(Asn/Gln) amidotransferase subunit C n=1 Tax=Candidatus Paracaedimonas acanthamoebae TaxID=244581 RepID=A0A8J7PIG3_9PROT|nr:Asp-tRNA(Asn)/Glu-tRNA(Gln) amidotransferase subunit GatC [Candidatus Paracaedimonas acanthamoebae]